MLKTIRITDKDTMKLPQLVWIAMVVTSLGCNVEDDPTPRPRAGTACSQEGAVDSGLVCVDGRWGLRGSGSEDAGTDTNIDDEDTGLDVGDPTPVDVGVDAGPSDEMDVGADMNGSDSGMPGCADGSSMCAGQCGFDLTADLDNCGACGVQASWACESGVPVDMTEVSLGAAHSCALTTTGDIWCWGRNNLGQLGSSTNNGNDDPNPTPSKVMGLPTMAGLALGLQHSCGWSQDGEVWCWGSNRDGQLGSQSAGGLINPTPVKVQGVADVTQLALGASHSCALTMGKEVWCWGGNAVGQVGTDVGSGTDMPIQSPIKVSAVSGIKQIIASQNATCALADAGTVECWGSNQFGQLGNTTNLGTTMDNPTPLPTTMPPQTVYSRLAAGFKHVCGVAVTGELYCWGTNQFGQLGNNANSGTETPNPTPLAVQALSNASTVALALGGAHSCVSRSGISHCWGLNQGGQLANVTNSGSIPANPSPLLAQGLTDVTSLSLGSDHSCAVLGDGRVECWGFNNLGQLGIDENSGTTAANPAPTRVLP